MTFLALSMAIVLVGIFPTAVVSDSLYDLLFNSGSSSGSSSGNSYPSSSYVSPRSSSYGSQYSSYPSSSYSSYGSSPRIYVIRPSPSYGSSYGSYGSNSGSSYSGSSYLDSLLGRDSSGSSQCSDQASVQSNCMYPLISYMLTDEGMNMVSLNIGRMTETQLKSGCRIYQSAGKCLGDFVNKCIPEGYSQMNEFLRATNEILTVCDSPDLYTKASVVMDCYKTMNDTVYGYSTCDDMKTKAMLKFSVASRVAPITMWTDGTFLRDFCCRVQKYQKCASANMDIVCGVQAVAIDASIYKAIYTAYDCNRSTRLQSCPTTDSDSWVK